MDPTYSELEYWEQRYARGGTSGSGSAGAEARWKVDQILAACQGRRIRTVLDLGCGDGVVGRMLLAGLPDGVAYLGLDQSPTVVEHCRQLAPEGAEYRVGDICSDDLPRADLVLCLDVLFHLESRDRHDSAVEGVCSSFRSLGIVACWNQKIVDLYRGHFAEHTTYRTLDLPPTVSDEQFDLPMVAEKTLHVLRRRRR